MLKENLVTLRKQKGLSQETVADRLHVVRQTVSKWEKGLSVPDADALQRLAELYEVSVSQLLGENIDGEPTPDRVAEQLAAINEQLAIKNRRARRIWKIIGIILLTQFLIGLLGAVLFTAKRSVVRKELESESITESWEEITKENWTEELP